MAFLIYGLKYSSLEIKLTCLQAEFSLFYWIYKTLGQRLKLSKTFQMKLKKILILRSIQKFKSQMELIQLQELDALFKFLDNLTTTNHEFEIILSITEESLTKLQKSKFFIHKQVSIQTSSKIH